MVNEVILDQVSINVLSYKDNQVASGKGQLLKKIIFDFHVTSEDYHRITTFLYKKVFDVDIPEKEWSFKGMISNYSTSFTNLYEENQVGVFHLELIELEG